MKCWFHWVVVVASVCCVAPVMGEHLDISLVVDPSGELTTGLYDFDGGTIYELNHRVFTGTFDGPYGDIWTTSNPGFNGLANHVWLPEGYTALPGEVAIYFDALAFEVGQFKSNLWFWDGMGQVEFQPIDDGLELAISRGPVGAYSAVLNGSDSDVSGFEIGETLPNGLFHRHLDFSVYPTGDRLPATGVYVWSLMIHVGDDLTSQPIYFVNQLGDIDSYSYTSAVDWVQSNVVPEPAMAWFFIAMSSAAMFCRQRI